MQDGIAELFAERNLLSQRSFLPLILSATLHAVIAAPVLLNLSKPEPDRKEILSIRLMPTRSTPKAPVAAPKKRIEKKPVPIVPVPPPKALPVNPPLPTPAPTKSLPKPVQPAAVPEKISKFATKPAKPAVPVPATVTTKSPPVKSPPAKPATTAPTPKVSSRPVGGTAALPAAVTIPPVGQAGVASLDGPEFPFTPYLTRMVALIGQRWLRPQTEGDALAQVYFVIDRNGSIRDVKIEKPSGSNSFDRAAMRAVLESSPIPPLPPAYSGTHLGVHLTFH